MMKTEWMTEYGGRERVGKMTEYKGRERVKEWEI
jgi:hypothetical protein